MHELAETEAFDKAVDGYLQKDPPGTRFAYCNGGYIVLALVAERASGRPFHDLVEREVCDRARLGGTRFPRSDDLPGDAALGYLHPEGNRTNVLHLPVRGHGDGEIYTSADDLRHFWRALTGGDIVDPMSVTAMTHPRHDVPAEACATAWASGCTRPGPPWSWRATTPASRSAARTIRPPARPSASSGTPPKERGP